MANEWKNVGTIRKGKKRDDGKEGNLYIKINEDIILKKDDVLQIQDPRKKLDALVASGKITSDVALERKGKIPEYIRHEVVLPPRKA